MDHQQPTPEQAADVRSHRRVSGVNGAAASEQASREALFPDLDRARARLARQFALKPDVCRY